MFLPAACWQGGGSIVNIVLRGVEATGRTATSTVRPRRQLSLLTRAVALDFITQGIRCSQHLPRHRWRHH